MPLFVHIGSCLLAVFKGFLFAWLLSGDPAGSLLSPLVLCVNLAYKSPDLSPWYDGKTEEFTKDFAGTIS